MVKTVSIRKIREDEKKYVDDLLRRSLGPIDLVIFSASLEDALKNTSIDKGNCLVAEIENKIIGSVSMKIRQIGGSEAGFIGALVTDKEHRGYGIAGSLVEEAMKWLSHMNCGTIYATVDRYNSGSWNTFIHRGFSVYELTNQLRDYGLGFFRLWLAEYHFIGYGTFFLRKKYDDNHEMSERWHFLFAWAGLFAIWTIQALRWGQPVIILPVIWGVTGVSLLVPELLQKLTGRILGLQTVFKTWEPGILFSLLLAVFGSFFPAYGSTYVKKIDYRYDFRKKENGIFFTAAPVVSLLLAFGFWGLSTIISDSVILAGVRVGYMSNLINTLFNLIPVQAAGGLVWDGKKILTWSRAAWLILVFMTIVLIVIDI
jgi:ribosomal protein S18 acetylase RimI-like enzyme